MSRFESDPAEYKRVHAGLTAAIKAGIQANEIALFFRGLDGVSFLNVLTGGVHQYDGWSQIGPRIYQFLSDPAALKAYKAKKAEVAKARETLLARERARHQALQEEGPVTTNRAGEPDDLVIGSAAT